ncbi:MAG: transporter substrate-binding domain-containing protein [Erysipelotrichaceae bacterium]|nr:transporter substrate-binding domain-containing protein [Erysipelotrichaceae bacterium]
MKKILTLMLGLLMILTLCACQKNDSSDKDLLATIQERGKLIVASEQDWPPFTYEDAEGNLAGFDVELAKLIAEKLGVEFEPVRADFDSALQGVSSGRFDLTINGVSYTEERALSYNFSDPYVYDKAALIVREDETEVKSLDDVKGKIGTNSRNSIYADLLIEYGVKNGDQDFKYVDTFEQTIDNLTRGTADVTLNAYTTYVYYVETVEDPGVKVVDFIDGGDQYVVCAAGGSKAEYTKTLIDEVNRILDELRADGTLSELSIKYFGEDITE